jgi:hypothetical protein
MNDGRAGAALAAHGRRLVVGMTAGPEMIWPAAWRGAGLLVRSPAGAPAGPEPCGKVLEAAG